MVPRATLTSHVLNFCTLITKRASIRDCSQERAPAILTSLQPTATVKRLGYTRKPCKFKQHQP